jgi:hypothetical protein
MDLWDQSTTADDAGKPAAMAQLTSEPTGENKPALPAAPGPPEQKPEAPPKTAAPTAPTPQAPQGGAEEQVSKILAPIAKQVSDIGLVPVSSDEYDSIMRAAKNSPDPQTTIAKASQAMMYQKLLGIPADKAMDYLPALNKAFVGDPMPSQENFGNTVSKALDNGSYFLQAGRIGGLLANDPHNPELRAAADYVNKKLEETAPYAQKNIFTQALQMAPFMIDGLATSALGGVGGIASMVTAVANVAQMSATMRGADFLRIQRDTQAALVKKGVDPEEAYQKATDVAGPISQTSGIIEGSLGELLGGFPALRGLMGKEAAPITSKIIDAIMQDGVTSRVGQKLALQGGLHYAGSALESGANMAAFELTQRLSDKTAAVLSDSGVPQPTAAAIAKDVGGAFGNGILIGLITGVPALAKAEIGAVRAGSAEAATRLTEAKNLATLAKTFDQDGFKAAVDRLPDLVSFKGVDPKDKAAQLDQIWKTSHASEAPEATGKSGEAPEGKTTTPAAGEAPEPATGSTAPLARDEGGKLYANDEPVVLRRDGSSMIMEDRIGDPTSQKAYSLHQFTVDDEAKTVTVDSMRFKQGTGDAEREEMARQYVDRLQQRYPGFDIKWEPSDPKLAAIRDKIIADNPQGLEKGLNYYPDKEAASTPFKADEFRQKAQAAFGLKDNEADAALSLVHAFAKGEGTDAETWLRTHLDPRMIANAGEKQIAQGNKAGTSFTDSEGKPIAPEKVSQVQGHAKALIIATKAGDFSSIAHELFHVAQLTTKDTEIRKAISDYFGIPYDKLGRDAMEHLADNFERYLTSGRADAHLKGAFGKIADIMARYVSEFVRRLKGNPKLEAIFDKMLGSDTPFGEALRKADDQIKGREVKEVEPGSMEDKYNKIKGTQGGRVLDVDIARELVPGYKPEEAGKVHEEASAIIKQRYAELLQGPVAKGKEPFVLFTAGGSGAGKTTAIRTTLDGLRGKADIIYEGMMSKVESSVKKIDQALESGRDVNIAYVHRSPVDAWHSVLDRAEETGRTVPLDAHAEAHSNVQTTIEKLQGIYKDTPQVIFHAIDNNQGPGKAREVPFETLPKIETQNLKEQLHEGLTERYRAGSISEKTYRGSVPTAPNEPRTPEGNNGATWEGAGGQPESQRPEVSQVEEPVRGVPAREGEKIAKEATTVQHELANELGALNGALKLGKGDRAKILEQYGFKAGDEPAIRARVAELEGKVQAWDNWSTDPAKYQELRRRAGLPFKQDVIDAASQTEAETGRPEEPMLFQHDDDLEEARQYKSPEEWMKATGAKDEDADFYKKTWEEATQKPLVSSAQARVDFANEVKADNHALGHELLKAIGENLLNGKIADAHAKGGRELSVIDAYALDKVSGRQITEAKWMVIDAWIEKNPDKYRTLTAKLLGRDDITRQMGAEGDGTAPREPVRIKGSNSDQDAQVAGAALQRLVDKLEPEAADKLSSEKWTKASAQAYAESTRKDIARLQAKVDKSQAEVQQLKDLMKAQRAGQLASEQRTAYEKTVRRNPGPTIDYAHAQIVRAVMDFLDPIDQGKRVMTDEKNAVFAKYDELAKQFLTPEQIDKIKTAPLNEWSTKDLKDLAGSLRELRQAGRDEYFAKASERKARLDDQAMEVRQTLVANHPADGRAPVGSKEYQDANGGKLGRMLRSFDLPQTNILREARTIDGKEDGPVQRIVMKEVEADRASDTMSRARKAALAEALKGQDLDVKHFYDKKGEVQIMGKTFNRATLMSLYVGMQDSFSRGHIVYGNFMSHVDREAMAGHPELEEAGDRITSAIRQATDTLTAKEKAVADAYLANMNEHRGRFFNAEVELDNKSPENVQAYFPCYLNEPEDPRGFKADIMGLFGLKKQTNKGATINRIDIAPENQKSINLDFFSVYEKAIESQERFIAMAPFLRDWNAVFGSSNRSTIVREEIGNRLGAEHVQYLDDWAGCVANPKAWDRIQDMEKGMSTAARYLRGGLTTAYLGFRSAMGVQHIATYWMPYIPHAGGELLHQMLVHLNPVTALKDWAWIKEQSAVVRNIKPGIAVHDLAKMDFGNAAMNKIRDLSMLFEQGSQNYAVLNGWKAMYDKTIAAGQADLGSGKITGDQLHIQAVNKADEITLKVQPTWQPEYIAPALRSKNGMMKIITQFMEPMNVVYNQLRHDVPDAIADGHLMKAAGIVTSLMAVGAVYGLIRAPQEDDDDATQKMKDVFAGIAKEGIDSILFVGPILDGLVDSAITGHTLFQQKTEAFPAADQMINALQKIESGNGGGVALMEAFAVALGLPVSAVKDYYRAFGGDLGALIGRPAKK